MGINNLIKELRNKRSRDNRGLLDEAAGEFLLNDKRRFGERTVEDAGPCKGSWISTTERVPLRTGEYIVVIEGFSVATALYYDAAMRVWIDRLDEDPAYYRVSFWMEMPEVPGKMQSAECRVQSCEVIKGLVCCRTENGHDCNECPYWGRQYAPGSGGCSNQLVNDALELINKLMEERK